MEKAPGRGRNGRRRWLWAIALAAAATILAGVFAPYLMALNWWRQAGEPGLAAEPPKLAAGLAPVDDWFVVARIGPGVHAIGEPRYGQCNFAYLFTGTDRALLFDSGPGLRDIAAVVAGLTTLPVTVLPSHLHFDHVGGLKRFKDVALPDLPALRNRATLDGLLLGRFQHLGFVEGMAVPTIRVTRWIAPGTRIDLGGRSLSFTAAPGHSDDSIVLTDHASGDLFTGDTLYPGQVYAFLPGTDLVAYAQTVAGLADRVGPGVRIHGGHGCSGAGPVTVPTQSRAALLALQAALARARRPAPDVAMPRRFDTDAGLTLLAKHPWMAK